VTYIQVPTTLLAAVDSSVGGKTAIDLAAGKNLAGAFYQPSLVLCDTNVLSTLPPEVFRDGCAEVIKYGVLYDPDLFDHLSRFGLAFHRGHVITRCVELKRNVVAQDEFDHGQRQKLNLGHTIGHAVEAQSHFEISHGQAVAIGMAIISRAAAAKGICTKATQDRILATLSLFDLPTQTHYTPHQLYTSALSDKKRSGESVNLIVPQQIGQCSIMPIPVDQLESFIQAGI
jgi:3-dehydroquinate synthase